MKRIRLIIATAAIFSTASCYMLMGGYESERNVSQKKPSLYGLNVKTEYELKSDIHFHSTSTNTIRINSGAVGLQKVTPHGKLMKGTVIRINRTIEHSHLNFGTSYYLEGEIRSGKHKGLIFRIYENDEVAPHLKMRRRG